MVICTEPIVLVLCTSVLCWFQRDLGKKKSIGFIYEFLSLSQEAFFLSHQKPEAASLGAEVSQGAAGICSADKA